jgi:protein-L-isoaspartate(D-aspartate) O-methyltransferase
MGRRIAIGIGCALLAACSRAAAEPDADAHGGPDPWAGVRAAMVRGQIEARGVRDPRVLSAMRQVPRHAFVPAAYRAEAYQDHALPIEEGQTISQPYIVAVMSELARVRPGAKVLEVGTGSGYQAAVLAAMGARVWSIEIVTALCRSAARRLRALGYSLVQVRCGDGYAGWPENAPFDAIVVTAAPPHVPRPLEGQLAVGGHLVLPVGDQSQELVVIEKTEDGRLTRRSVFPVAFVPMTGEAQAPRTSSPAPGTSAAPRPPPSP